jgi:3-hydroxyisobutyrate dehydrogenase-like beta-hydroxyacid dehydrogenase
MAEIIGFIGLGNMGKPIAENLRRAGYGLRVFNRTRSKAADLTEKGAVPVTSPAEVAQAGGAVFTMLADDRAVEEACFAEPSFVEVLGQGGIHVSLSTISPATARRLAEHHEQFGVAYVAAPVFGRPDAAAAAKLVVCTSGAALAKKNVEPMLKSIGQAIFDFGEDAGAANVVKLCGNFLIASALEALAESLTLAEKNAIDKRKLVDMLGRTLFACPIYQNYGKQIAEQRFQPPGFRLALGLKDVDLTWQTAKESATPMPLAGLLHDRWLTSVAKGRGDLDWSAIALDVEENAGIVAEKAAG